ncbi:MAG: hypothetical protein ACD_4C00044G0001, partial [uncultured bacterium (gcode 4)]
MVYWNNRENPDKISKINYLWHRVKNLAAVFATSVAIWLSWCWWWGKSDSIQNPAEISNSTSWFKMKQNKIWDNVEISFEINEPNSKIVYIINWDFSELNDDSVWYEWIPINLELWDVVYYRLVKSDWTLWEIYSFLNYSNLLQTNNLNAEDWSLAGRIQQEESNIIKYENDLNNLANSKQIKQSSLDQISTTINQIKTDISSNNSRVANISAFLSNIANLLNSTSSLDDNFDENLKNIINSYYNNASKITTKSLANSTITNLNTNKISQRIDVLNSEISSLNSDISRLESEIILAQNNYNKKYNDYITWKNEADIEKVNYNLARSEYFKYKWIYEENSNKFHAIESILLSYWYDSYLNMNLSTLFWNYSNNLPYVKNVINGAAQSTLDQYKNKTYILDSTSKDKISSPNQNIAKQTYFWWDYQVFVEFNATNNWKNYKANVYMITHNYSWDSNKRSNNITVVNNTNIADLRDVLYSAARSSILWYNIDNMIIYKTNMDNVYDKAFDTAFEWFFSQIAYETNKQSYEMALSDLSDITTQITTNKQNLASKKSQLETKKIELTDCQSKIASAQNDLNTNEAYLNNKNNELAIFETQKQNLISEIQVIEVNYSQTSDLYLASQHFVDTNKNNLNQIKPNDPVLAWQTEIVNWTYAYVNWGNYWTNVYKANPLTIYVRYWNNYPATMWAEYKTNDQLTVSAGVNISNLDDLKTSKSKFEEMIKKTQNIVKYWWLPENWNSIRNITSTDLNNFKSEILSYTAWIEGGPAWQVLISWKEWLYKEALRLYFTASFKYFLDNDSNFKSKYYEVKFDILNKKISEIESFEWRTVSNFEKNQIAEQIAKWIIKWTTDWWVDFAMSYKDTADGIYTIWKSLISIDWNDVKNFFFWALNAIKDPINTIETVWYKIKEDIGKIKSWIYAIINKLEYIWAYWYSYWSSYAWSFIWFTIADPIWKFFKWAKVAN